MSVESNKNHEEEQMDFEESCEEIDFENNMEEMDDDDIFGESSETHKMLNNVLKTMELEPIYN